MSYDEYLKQMDELQEKFDFYSSIDNFAGMDRIQSKMDAITAAVTQYYDRRIRQ